MIVAEAQYKPDYTENQKAFVGLCFILGLIFGIIFLL